MFVKGLWLVYIMMKQVAVVFTLVFLIGCTVENIEPLSNRGVEYFSLQTGSYIIYQVDQTIYELETPSNSSYQLKESVIDSFVNLTGDYTYTIHREIWDDVQGVWNLSEVWSARKSATEAVLSEGNTDYLKLKFPLIAEKKWNGNLYNMQEEMIYKTDSIDLIYNIDAQSSIANTITIVQQNNQDKIVETDYRMEKYAPEIGLIYKEIINLEYCTSSDACLGQQIIESGLTYKQAIIAYGDE